MKKNNFYKDKEYTQRILYEAAKDGKLEIVETLIENGANVDNTEYSPLIAACENGRVDVVKLLIDKKANVNIQDKRETPLQSAASKGHFEIVKLLVSKGATVNQKNKHGDSALARAIFGSGYGDFPEYTQERKNTILFLLKNKADISEIDIFKHSYWGVPDMNVVKFLLENGFPLQNKNKPKRPPQSEYNPGLLYKVFQNDKIDVKIIKQIIELGADVNHNTGSSSVLYAMIPTSYGWLKEKNPKRSVEICKLLIQAGADILDTTDNGGNPLSSAIHHKNLDLVKFMFKTSKLDIPNDPRSKKLIHDAVSSGKKEILQFLISKGIKEINCEDKYKWTPLHNAIAILYPDRKNSIYSEKYDPNEMIEIIRILLKNGANVNAKTHKHSSPLHFAAKTNMSLVIKILLDGGADRNERGKFGFTALHYAANNSCLNSIDFLLKEGLDINEKDDFGFTSLHHASYKGNAETVKFLLKKGADFTIADNYGNTPLHYVAREGRTSKIEKEKPTPKSSELSAEKIELVKLLIKQGADVHTKNNKGESPLALAIQRSHKEIVEFLKRVGNQE